MYPSLRRRLRAHDLNRRQPHGLRQWRNLKPSCRRLPDAEFVSLEETEAEQQGKKKPATADATGAAGEEEEVEIGDESLADAAFIEEQEEGTTDVTDIIGESIEKEEES